MFRDTVGETTEDQIAYYGNVEEPNRLLKVYQELEEKWLAYDFSKPYDQYS